MRKSNLNPIILKIIFAVVSAITIAISFINLESNKFTMVAIASTIELITFIVITKLITGKFVDYSVIFISILFLFHFGQLILLGIFEGISRANELRIVLDFIPTDKCVCVTKPRSWVADTGVTPRDSSCPIPIQTVAL